MEVKLNIRNVDLRDAQEKVEDNVKQLRNMSRKAVLAYVGVLGLAVDEAKAVLERGQKLVEQAERRGEKLERKLEKEATRELKRSRRELEKRVKRLQKQLQKLQKQGRKSVRGKERKTEKLLERQVEEILERMGIPSRERIEKLNKEIDALARKIDQALAEQQPQVALPIPDYDELSVREILQALDKLTPEQLQAIKEYEAAHKGRVTVLREVDRRLQETLAVA